MITATIKCQKFTIKINELLQVTTKTQLSHNYFNEKVHVKIINAAVVCIIIYCYV